MKKTDQPALIHVGVYLLLLLLSLTLFPWVHRTVLVSPARNVTGSFQVKAIEHGEMLSAVKQLTDVSENNSPLKQFDKALSRFGDRLAFGEVLTVASIVAAHVVNIYLILSGPVGMVLLVLLFLMLSVLVFRDINRLRNISMATGIAAYVFMVAIPLAVIASDQLSKVYSGGLRYSCRSRIDQFEEGFLRLEAEAASGISTGKKNRFRTELTILQKGLVGLVTRASASLLLDMVLLPVFLTWIFYRFGILSANTLFGSFRIQKMGRLLKTIFKGDDE